ncbi:MAG: hypothetical protein ACYC0L_07385, partial [Thermoleophilia bacterium]
LLLAVCFWAPLAWADAAAGVATGQDQASLTAAAPGSQNPDNAPAGKSTAGNTGDGSSLKTANNVNSPSSGAAGGDTTGTTTASAGASPSTTAAASTAPTTATAETGGSTASGSSGSAVAAQYNTNNDETGESGCKDCQLELICKYGYPDYSGDPRDPGVYWDSHDDYLDHLLTVKYKVKNKGPGTANNTHVTGATATKGVTVATSPLPDLGKLLPGESIVFSLKWLLPEGVGSFTTSLTICSDCDNDDDNPGDGDNDDPGDINNNDKPKDKPNGGNNSLGNGPTGVQPTANGNAGVQAQATSNLTASSLPATLPSTGFNLATAIIFAMGIAALFTLVSVPAARLIRIRRK